MEEPGELLSALVELSHRAGDAILRVYATDFGHEAKPDESPVTAADLAAEAVIADGLKRVAPEVPLVAEEAAAAGRLPDITGGRFWLVDPLDGTREFISRNGEFTVNIALIDRRRPVLGVIHAPALGLTFTGIPAGGATRRRNDGIREEIAVRPARTDEAVTIVASRRHGDPVAIDRLLRGHPVSDQKTAGSSLKFCMVACGEADLYPRFGRTMEWDTAAGQAIVTAAGGRVTDRHGAELAYGKTEFENPPFIAWGGIAPWPERE